MTDISLHEKTRLVFQDTFINPINDKTFHERYVNLTKMVRLLHHDAVENDEQEIVILVTNHFTLTAHRNHQFYSARFMWEYRLTYNAHQNGPITTAVTNDLHVLLHRLGSVERMIEQNDYLINFNARLNVYGIGRDRDLFTLSPSLHMIMGQSENSDFKAPFEQFSKAQEYLNGLQE